MADKRVFLVMLLAFAAWAVLSAMGGDGAAAQPSVLASPTRVKDVSTLRGPSVGGALPPLNGATAWLNSPPLSPSDLRGKVVLVEFWTYTCINWRRQFPYVRAWATKYREHGLVVIGVHPPEFTFEKDLDHVVQAAQDIGVAYPVAVDSQHKVWNAFGNAYWPALYLVDAKGRVRHHHFGEGDYEESERLIQQLLTEGGAVGVPSDLVGET